MNDVLSSIHRHVDPFNNAVQPTRGRNGSRTFDPVRIAILDSGFDPASPHIENDTPRIQDIRSFVPGTDPSDMQDEIGHGTHTLGLLLKFATCAETYVARVANQETLGRGSYDAITQVRLILAPTQ
jgi:subtilisin family serine protease